MCFYRLLLRQCVLWHVQCSSLLPPEDGLRTETRVVNASILIKNIKYFTDVRKGTLLLKLKLVPYILSCSPVHWTNTEMQL